MKPVVASPPKIQDATQIRLWKEVEDELRRRADIEARSLTNLANRLLKLALRTTSAPSEDR